MSLSLLNDNFFVESGSEKSNNCPPTDNNTLVPNKPHSQGNSGGSNTTIL